MKKETKKILCFVTIIISAWIFFYFIYGIRPENNWEFFPLIITEFMVVFGCIGIIIDNSNF
jgi:hypothetical protein